MELLSSFFGSEQRNAKQKEEETQRRKMNDGYPVTENPFVPDILKHAVDSATIQDKNGDPKIRLILSPEGSDLVEPKSLELIRERMHIRYGKYKFVSKNFKNSLPKNTIAVSFAERNFKVGNSCQEFSLIHKFKSPKSSHFYYQKLSENFQVTYYNENGIDYVAGYCYYLGQIGQPMYLDSHAALMTLSRSMANEYPLADREKAFRTVTYKCYGRFCKTSGSRITVDCSGRTGNICHMEFDHVSRRWKDTPCEECTMDYYTYKWEEPKNTPLESAMSSVKPLNSSTSSTSFQTTPESTTSSTSSETSSPSTSTKGLLKEYDMIEDTTEHNHEFNAAMVN